MMIEISKEFSEDGGYENSSKFFFRFIYVTRLMFYI